MKGKDKAMRDAAKTVAFSIWILAVFFCAPVLAEKVTIIESKIVYKDNEITDYPIHFKGTISGKHHVVPGRTLYLGLYIRNKGKKVIRIIAPCSAFADTESAKLSISGERGEVTATTSRDAFESSKLRPVISLKPGEEIALNMGSFEPWIVGKYKYELTFKNRTKTKTEMGTIKVAGRNAYGWKEVPIENVWVGKVVISGEIQVVKGIDGKHAEDIQSVNTKKVLKDLRAVVLDKNIPLRDRINALRKLSDMKHQHATNLIVELEKKTRKNKVIHSQIIRALYDITCKGCGFLVLDTIVSISKNKEIPLADRKLCIDLLRMFANSERIEADGKIIHIIAEEERAKAAAALKALGYQKNYEGKNESQLKTSDKPSLQETKETKPEDTKQEPKVQPQTNREPEPNKQQEESSQQKEIPKGSGENEPGESSSEPLRVEKSKPEAEPIEVESQPGRKWLVLCLIVVIIVQAGIIAFLLLRRGR